MRKRAQLEKIITVASLMIGGLIIFKWLPMLFWGPDILFDASIHIATAVFILYCIWFFIDQNENWHLPFFIFSALLLFIISVQRILVDAHNDVGLLLGLIIAVSSIWLVERKNLKGKLKF